MKNINLMNTKKIMGMILLICIMLLSLSACGKNGEEPPQKGSNDIMYPGSIYKFGKYEQDNNPNNGKEEIEWLVLTSEGNKALLVSKYALAHQRYNTYAEDVTWENCTLRKWLNETFINDAFSREEQQRIITTAVTMDNNPKYGTSGGNDTTDKVFLLSIKEANNYFQSDESRSCAATDFAIAQGVQVSDIWKADDKPACWWWLRSPGHNLHDPAGVSNSGTINLSGGYISSDERGVRPALWIDIAS